ncbi:MAG: glycosyltransferase [Thermoplasmata archaeon]|nr:glycosyltransferase [Thermoplasmata archaeon]
MALHRPPATNPAPDPGHLGISGFMAIRDGLRLGYPFPEAIRAALPAVDEFVVVDGHSSDGTFEQLDRLAAAEPKLRLSQHRWDAVSVNGSAIRNALEQARSLARGEYIWQVDANEILPPEDIEPLRMLGASYPGKELFGLPYVQLLGSIEFTSEVRWRFARNLPTIHPLYDGWTLGYRLGMRDLSRPRELKRLLKRASVRVAQDRVATDLPEQIVVLPRPLFRYYGLFPEPFLEKMAGKQFFQQNPEYRRVAAGSPMAESLVATYRSTGDWDGFWDSVYDLHARVLHDSPLNKEIRTRRKIPRDQHPAVIQPLLGLPNYPTSEPGDSRRP